MSEGLRLLWGRELPGIAYGVAWSPDGGRLAVAGSFAELLVLDSSGSRLWAGGSGKGFTYGASWSPTGRYVAFAAGSAMLVVLDAERGVEVYADGEGSGYTSSWSPDGRLVAAGGVGGLALYERVGGRTRRLWRLGVGELGEGARVYRVSFTPDGSKVIAAGCLRDRRAGVSRGCLWALGLDGTLLWRSLIEPLSPEYDTWAFSTAVSPDGRLAAVVGVRTGGWREDLVRVYDVETGAKLWEARVGLVLRSVTWAGDLILVGDDDGCLHVWEWQGAQAERRGEHRVAELGVAWGHGLDYNPAHRLLAVASRDRHAYTYDASKVVEAD